MNTQEKIDALRYARCLIAMPDKWTKGTWFRAATGHGLASSTRRDWTCACAGGAVRLAFPVGSTSVAYIDHELDVDAPGGDYVAFNDSSHTTHADVIALFDRTIARLEASL